MARYFQFPRFLITSQGGSCWVTRLDLIALIANEETKLVGYKIVRKSLWNWKLPSYKNIQRVLLGI